jgi:general secretion pathway protein C
MLHCVLLLLAAGQVPSDLRLSGVVFAPTPERRAAVLASGGRSRTVQPGETAFGVRLVDVEPERVRIQVGDGLVELSLTSGPGVATAPVVSAEPAPEGMQIQRAELERRISMEAARIAAETTLIPISDADGVTGFALTRVPEDTVLGEAGLRSGDVLQSINDTPIDSLATLASLWGRLQGARTIEAQILRDGRPLSLTVRLSD